jgi:hypothetical protein
MGSSLIQLTVEQIYDLGNVDHFSCNTRILKVIVYLMERWLETVDQSSGRLGQGEISVFP